MDGETGNQNGHLFNPDNLPATINIGQGSLQMSLVLAPALNF